MCPQRLGDRQVNEQFELILNLALDLNEARAALEDNPDDELLEWDVELQENAFEEAIKAQGKND